MKAYIVFFGNYYPREIDTFWNIRDKAKKRADELGNGWNVEEAEWSFEQGHGIGIVKNEDEGAR